MTTGPDIRATIEASRWVAFNKPPPNFTEVSETEFMAARRFEQGSLVDEYRQIHPCAEFSAPWAVGIFLHWLADGTGWAITGEPETRTSPAHVRYFHFALCEHLFGPDEGKVMFDHVYTCVKCGYRAAYDSSG